MMIKVYKSKKGFQIKHEFDEVKHLNKDSHPASSEWNMFWVNQFHIFKCPIIKPIVMFTRKIVATGLALGGCIILFLFIFSPIPSRLRINDVLIGIFFGIIISFVNFLITKSVSKIFPKHSHRRCDKIWIVSDNPYATYMLVIENVLIEELLFRSFLLTIIMSYCGVTTAIIVTSILFVCSHIRPRIIELTIMGISFAILVIVTGNIITSIMAHLLINTLFYFSTMLKKDKLM